MKYIPALPHFMRSIRGKLVLMSCIACAALAVSSAAQILGVSVLLDVSRGIILHDLPRQHLMQDVTSAVMSMNIYAAQLIRDDFETDTARESYRSNFTESATRTRTFLDALTYGSKSDAFTVARNGVSHADWENYEDANLEVPAAEESLAKIARDLGTYVDAYEHGVLSLHDQRRSGTSSMAQIGELERAVETTYLWSIHSKLIEMQHYIVSVSQSKIDGVSHQVVLTQVGTILIGIFGIALTLLTSSLFAQKYIAHPLRLLAEGINNITQGNIRMCVSIDSKDEIGALATSFDTMAARLASAYESLEQRVNVKTKALQDALSQLGHEKERVEATVRERTEDLRTERNKFYQVATHMRGSGVLFDTDLRVLFMNATAQRLFGYSETSELAQFERHYRERMPSSPALRELCAESAAIPTLHILDIRTDSGVFELFLTALRDEQDTITSYFMLVFDVTETRLLEQTKSDLVAVASHQLRTPLTAVRANTEMLSDESYGPLTTEQKQLVSDISASTIRLIMMVNEMLDITKIERGKLDLSLEILDCRDIVKNVLDDVHTHMSEMGITVTCTGFETPLVAFADRTRIRNVFQNIIENAIKYGKRGGHLSISAEIREPFVQLRFADDGIGIPEQEHGKMFERFYRASNATRLVQSGSGLGLYIVRAIVLRHGGDLWFESKEGVGTTFFVTFPTKEIVARHVTQAPITHS